MGAYEWNVGKITSLQNSLQPRDIVAHEIYIQRVIAFCQASNSLTFSGQPRLTAENRDPSDFALTLWKRSGQEHEAPYKMFFPCCESLRSDWYSPNIGTYGRTPGKIVTPKIFIKLEQALAGRITKYGVKYFSRAVSRLACRGQIDIQVTWEPKLKCRENHITSEFTPTSGYRCIWNLQSTSNSILPGIE